MTDLKDLDWAFARSQDIEGLLHQHLLGYAGSAPEFSGHIQLPGEIEFSKESSGKSFGFSMGIGLEKAFGKEIADGISNALGKVKIGTLPIGPGFGSLALSEADGQSMKSFNTNIVVSSNLTMQVRGEASIKGAHINAGYLLASFDSLVLESVRSIVQNEAWGASLGISGSTGDKSTPMGKLNHIGANHRSEDGAIVDQITRLIGRETATVVVARAMHLNAAMIANAEIDDDGHYTDKGRLALKVGQLFIQNMQSYDRGEIYGLGIDLLHNNLSTENSDDKPNDIPFAFQVPGSSAFGIQSLSRTLVYAPSTSPLGFLPGFLKCFGYKSAHPAQNEKLEEWSHSQTRSTPMGKLNHIIK